MSDMLVSFRVLLAAVEASMVKKTVLVPSTDYYARPTDFSREDIVYVDGEELLRQLNSLMTPAPTPAPTAAPASPWVPWTKAQIRRVYDNNRDIPGMVKSYAAFERLVILIEQNKGMRDVQD